MFDDQLNAPPIVEMHEGIYVVRDDLLEGGSKTRFIQSLVRDFPGNEMVYGSSPATGYAQIALARVCSNFNKKCTLFMAKRFASYADLFWRRMVVLFLCKHLFINGISLCIIK